MTAYTVVYPLDLLKTLLAVNINKTNKQGIFKIMASIVKEKGFKHLYKGLNVTLCGIAPYASLKLTFF